MKNGVGVAQNIVLFGGTSEIGQAILRRVVKPGVSRVVLVSRNIDHAETVTNPLADRFPEVDFHPMWSPQLLKKLATSMSPLLLKGF